MENQPGESEPSRAAPARPSQAPDEEAAYTAMPAPARLTRPPWLAVAAVVLALGAALAYRAKAPAHLAPTTASAARAEASAVPLPQTPAPLPMPPLPIAPAPIVEAPPAPPAPTTMSPADLEVSVDDNLVPLGHGVSIKHYWLPPDPADAPRGDEMVFSTMFNTHDHPLVIGDSIEAVVDGRPQRITYRPSGTQPGALKIVVRLPGRRRPHTVVLLPIYNLATIGGTGIGSEKQSGSSDAQGHIGWKFEAGGSAAALTQDVQQSGPVHLGQ